MSVRGRVWRAFALVAAGLLFPLGRLAWLQVLSPSAGLTAEAHRRLYYQATVEPFRGSILARDGEPLAVDRLSFDIAVPFARFAYRPPRWLERLSSAADSLGLEVEGAAQAIEDIPPPWAVRLAQVADMPLDEVTRRRRSAMERVLDIRERVLARLSAADRRDSFRIREETVPQVVLSDVDIETAAAVLARPEDFPDLVVEPRRRRFYPMGSLACHVIGRLGVVEAGSEPAPPPGENVPAKRYLPGDEYGDQGIEKEYDWELRGHRGRRELQRRAQPAEDDLLREVPAAPGRDVVLALDLAAQQRAEAALGDQAGAVVVLDVETGEVLVCASAPGYDLNVSPQELAQLFDHRPGPLLNRAIRDAVPGGSVVKIATAVAGLQTGAMSPETPVNCPGAYEAGGLRWRCSAAHGDIDLRRAIEHSCNVYFFNVARRAGPVALAFWARRLGLGVHTGVDMPWERPGRFPDPQSSHGVWYLGNTLNTCIGQGDVQITPMQVAVMMAAVANGGKVLWPRMLRQDRDPAPRPQPRLALALNPSHLEAIRQGMRAVTSSGTARHVAGLAELDVAAKTGTAETPDPHVNYAWLAGFAPFRSPRYAFAVVIHRTPLHGADAAGPVAREVMQVLLRRSRPAASSRTTESP